MSTGDRATHGVAIIGCGDMGRAHAAAWKERADANVLAVFDIDESRMKALAEAEGAATCASWQEAVETEGVTIVSVCTPICFHAETSIHAARAGRHVLCEKAMALTLEDADAMIAAAAEGNVKLVVSYQHRTFPHHRKWHELVRDGVLEGPLFIRLEDVRGIRPKLAMHSRGRNGGPLVDMAGHFFDLVRYYKGAEPVSVSASGHCFGKDKAGLESVRDPAIDAAEMLVRYTDGHVLSASINWGLPKGHPGRSEACLVGPRAVSSLAGGKVSVRYDDREVLYETGAWPTGPSGRVADLVDAIANDSRPEVSGEDGRIALEVCLAALRAVETGETVLVGTARGGVR
jgi:predicted dehydrogenase